MGLRSGYPTLDYIIDEQHWCNGTEGVALHDPHMAVDKSHYECKTCREVVEPGMHPPGYVTGVPGSISAVLTGVTTSGYTVDLSLTEAEYDAIRQAEEAGDEAVIQRILDESPRERWLSWSISSS